MAGTRVHQFHSGSAVGDAVTNGMLLVRGALRKAGLVSDIYVESVAPELSQDLKPLGELDPSPEDVLLIHHSMGHDVMEYIAALNCKKILVYHNVTPPKFFSDSRWWQGYSAKGYDQLSVLREIVQGSIADSDYNADDLRRRGFDNVRTIPFLKDFKAHREHPFNQRHQHFDKAAYQLLFVGRIAGNKGQAELVEFMAAYADAFDYPLQLTLAGHSNHDGSGYAARIDRLISAYGLEERVKRVGHIADEDLYGLYRAADAYVSLSQHEGFGVPLVEAMAFDLPIVAYDAAAVASTLGGSGVLIPDTRPETIARALAPVLMSRKARRAVLAGQRRRLDDFDIEKLTGALFDFLEETLPEFSVPSRGTDLATPHGASGRRHYVVQGPCETSYSLSIVNRSLAIGLDRANEASVRVVPMEGHGDYPFNAAQAETFPDLPGLLKPREIDASQTVVTIRNTYPPRPAGMQGDFRLMNFFWEETEVPRATIDLMERHLDGVLVASAFGRAILRNSGLSIPIGVIGCGIDHHSVPDQMPSRSREEGEPFRFLHVSSGLARKGIEELLVAYVTAFTAADKVELVIKTYDNETNVVRALFDATVAHRPNAPIVHVIADSMADADIQALYSSADAVVLPTRGEGFNLPAAEAMISGVPVLVTGFSAHMDFCDPDTAWLIDFDFEASGSHVRSPNANWVRARAIDLAATMRQIFAGSPAVNAERDRKRAAAFRAASSLTWALAARKTDQFVDTLMTDAPTKTRLKVAWVSTWNTKCGIASYSEFLVPQLSPVTHDVTIFANMEQPNAPDLPNVVRNWSLTTDDITGLVDQIIDSEYDSVVIQYNFGFFSLRAIAEAVGRLSAKGIDTYIFFHKTTPSVLHGRSLSIADISEALKGATRLIVHTVDDVNRLKSYGLVDNVAQIPHGLPEAPAYDPPMVKRFLGMRDAMPLIASYGFLLPHKGVPELIMAFGLLRAEYPAAKLLLLNGEYPAQPSADEVRLCRNLIADLGLESDVILVTDYMDNEDVTLMLHAADAIVYPYQDTEESASGAVRFGLAALRPVAVTPLEIFKDVAEYCFTLPGTSALEIANGLRQLIGDDAKRHHLVERQKAWLEDVNWSQIGKRLSGMMIGLHNDTRPIRIVPEAPEPIAGRKLPERLGAMDALSRLGDASFVRLAYQRVLGRDPHAHERAVIGKIEDGELSREEFLSTLTLEAGALRTGQGDGQAEFVGFDDISDEDHEGFVKALYMRVLGREADEGGISSHSARLRSGRATRSDLIADFLDSDEFLENNRAITVVGETGPARAAAPATDAVAP